MDDSKEIRVGDLKPGPVRHASLPEKLVERIRAFKGVLDDVETTPLAATIENFQRDLNPEREIVIWECIAATYRAYALTHPDARPEVRGEVYKVLVATSVGIRDRIGIRHLTEQESAEVVLNFRQQCRARQP
jgi:hypothetical protein